jgi:thymidine kinase
MEYTFKKGLHIFIGPMFSGKTTKLLKTYETLSFSNSNDKVLLINHSSDNRYGQSHIISHDGNKCSCYSLNKLEEIYKVFDNTSLNNIEYVLIDEAQFFTDLYDVVLKLLKDGKNIFIAGLDGDFQQKPFYSSKLLELIPYSVTIQKFCAQCYVCKEPAAVTKRLTNSKDIILVGGSDDYQPACIKHAYVNYNS